MSELIDTKNMIIEVIDNIGIEKVLDMGEVPEEMNLVCDSGICGNMDCSYCPLSNVEDFIDFVRGIEYE